MNEDESAKIADEKSPKITNLPPKSRNEAIQGPVLHQQIGEGKKTEGGLEIMINDGKCHLSCGQIDGCYWINNDNYMHLDGCKLDIISDPLNMTY